MANLAKIPPTRQLDPLDFVSPGFRGLNTVEQGTIMDPAYCTTCYDAVIDTSGRLAARNGTNPLTTTPISGTPSIQGAFEYNQGGATYQQIISWAGGISNNITAPTNNLGGSVNVTNGRWFFQNFNNKCIGLQAGQAPIVYTGTGTFATVTPSAGTAPTGGIGCAAFGRLWVVGSDLQTIQYSGLLDETDWSTTDGNAGIIDMHTIWSDGTDQVTAIFPFNASLVICGSKHIIFFTDGRGSLLGMDPTQAYVFDELLGTGCVSQWTVDHIGETDVVFLSPNGLQSLLRLTTSRNNPAEVLSKYNRDTLLNQLTTETYANISGCYNNLTGFYILGMPITGVTWCFDMRRLYQDSVGAQCSITTLWRMSTTACYSGHSQGLFIARASKGTLTQYSGYTDEGSTYTFQYVSPWMTLGQDVSQRLKMLKRITVLLYTAGAEQFTLTWSVDFGNSSGSVTQTVPTLGALSQYGISQYGIDQYGSAGAGIYLYKYAAHIRGQYYQLGFTVPVTGPCALQQAQFAAKIGRVA
jgi:hypothetical protein